MMNLYSSQSSQKIDELAIKYLKLPETLLIKKAGFAALELIQKQFSSPKKIIVFCGVGNNGADGLMLAQYAHLNNIETEVIVFKNTNDDSLKNHYKQILSELNDLKIKIENFQDYPLAELTEKLKNTNLIVDAIFGIGLNKNPSQDYEKAINLINLSQSPVLSLDIPSGLSANTGNVLKTCINANATLTFITHKFGLYTADGCDVRGNIFFNSLGVDTEFINGLKQNNLISEKEYLLTQPIAIVPEFSELINQIPNRKKNTHKNNFGTALLIGGNSNMAGAIALAGFSSLKIGSGLVKVITRKTNLPVLPAIHPEIMSYDKKDFLKLTEDKNLSAIAIGPGLGNDNWAKKLFNHFLELMHKNDIPSVIDADGLNLLSQMDINNQPLKMVLQKSILTPHPKEAARLLNCSVEQIQQDRVTAIQKLQQKFNAIIVLKGSGSLIYDGKQMHLCQYGNSGMATGGMGDILTGIITGLLAQKINLAKSALIGTILHSYFADETAKKVGTTSLTPSDVLNQIRV